MLVQRSLFERTLQDRFETFHATNPSVYNALVTLARKWKSAGHRHCGIAMLFEVLRYEYGIRTTGDDFKLNNDFRSRYARKLMAEYPEFVGFFEIRELSAA